MTLTDDEVAMFYAIFACAERVDWACYEAFRLAILVEGAQQRAAHLAADTPPLNDEESQFSSPADTGPRASSLEPFLRGANPDYPAVKRDSVDHGKGADEFRTTNRVQADHRFDAVDNDNV